MLDNFHAIKPPYKLHKLLCIFVRWTAAYFIAHANQRTVGQLRNETKQRSIALRFQQVWSLTRIYSVCFLHIPITVTQWIFGKKQLDSCFNIVLGPPPLSSPSIPKAVRIEFCKWPTWTLVDKNKSWYPMNIPKLLTSRKKWMVLPLMQKII